MTDISVPAPSEMMPGKNGGQLRRGGGRPAMSESKKQALEFLREHSLDAARALLVKALQGDVRAAELVLAYSIGRPADKIELSGVDGGPIEMFEGFSDHERQALRAAIDAEIATRGEADAGADGAADGAGTEVRE